MQVGPRPREAPPLVAGYRYKGKGSGQRSGSLELGKELQPPTSPDFQASPLLDRSRSTARTRFNFNHPYCWLRFSRNLPRLVRPRFITLPRVFTLCSTTPSLHKTSGPLPWQDVCRSSYPPRELPTRCSGATATVRLRQGSPRVRQAGQRLVAGTIPQGRRLTTRSAECEYYPSHTKQSWDFPSLVLVVVEQHTPPKPLPTDCM